jgi:D-alanyl-D-alanine carboxypeptidase/D-alanyl-D-alanine-endopeptidase (penicillin-binding protein 4)
LCAEASADPKKAGGGALKNHLEALLTRSAIGDSVGLSVIDVATGKNVLTHGATTPRNPASNLKLLTAATALLELGTEFRTHTNLYGQIRDGHVSGGLCVQGQADPTLTASDFLGLAARLREEGVRDVDEVVVDASYFDAQVLPPAFEQQPNEAAPFRAGIAALSVNENAYTMRIRPGLAEGAPAIATIDGGKYFELDNQVLTTTKRPAPPLTVSERELTGDRAIVSLQGSVPLGGTTQVIVRRVPSPLGYSAHAFLDALAATGIAVPAAVRFAPCPPTAPLIVQQASPPLGQVIAKLGKDSDNFAAEMLLKTLGAERKKKPGTSADGVSVVQGTLRRLKLPSDGLTLINGSGLFQGNQVTTELLSQLLLTVYRNPALRDDFVAALAVGGVDGTLAQRFRSLPLPRIVRAKTGTLDDVIALSGYVLGPTPERAYVFSYLANGVSGKHPQARGLVDQIVEALAAQLYGRPLPNPG